MTVVRAFRPHVIVSVFTGTPRDGHGQHQVAGILAREAYDVAGDTVRFPRAATRGLGAWTPLEVLSRRAGQRATGRRRSRMNVGEYDPMLGRSYAEIAAMSRSQHQSQAFGSLQPKGVRFTQIRREASRVNEAQPTEAERSLFDGIDTTWARFRAPTVPAARAARLDSIRAQIGASAGDAATFVTRAPAHRAAHGASCRSVDWRALGEDGVAGQRCGRRTTRGSPTIPDVDEALAILRGTGVARARARDGRGGRGAGRARARRRRETVLP